MRDAARLAWALSWILGCDAVAVPAGATFGAEPYCGNGKADPGETPASCAADVCGPCQAGACALGPCSDGNPCTVDACVPQAGCIHTAQNAGTCADAAPCLLAPTCTAGACQGAPGLWQVQSMLSLSKNDALVAACPSGDGGLVAVGWELVEAFNAEHTDAVFVRYRPDGTLAAQHVLPDNKHNDQWLDVARLPDGRFLAVGFEAYVPVSRSTKVESRAAWAAFEPAGQGTKSYAKSNAFRLLRGVAVAQSGAALAVGRSDAKALAVRLHPALGEFLWEEEVGGPAGTAEFLAVAAAADHASQWLAVGWAEQGSGRVGWLQRFGDGATPRLDGRALAAASMNAMLTHVVAMVDGGWLVTGVVSAGPVPGPVAQVATWLVRLSAELQVLWEWTSPLHTDVGALALLADGPTVVLGGVGPVGESTQRLWLGFGLDGALRNQRTAPGVQPLDLVALGPRTVGMVSRTEVAKQHDAVVARLDRFGNASCAASGPCLGVAAPSCDDGNACTLDDCTAPAGCSHRAAANGTPCGTQRTCKEGACP